MEEIALGVLPREADSEHVSEESEELEEEDYLSEVSLLVDKDEDAPNKNIREVTPQAPNLKGGTRDSFQACDDPAAPEPSSKDGSGVGLVMKSKAQEQAEKDWAVASHAAIDQGDETPPVASREEARLEILKARSQTEDLAPTQRLERLYTGQSTQSDLDKTSEDAATPLATSFWDSTSDSSWGCELCPERFKRAFYLRCVNHICLLCRTNVTGNIIDIFTATRLISGRRREGEGFPTSNDLKRHQYSIHGIGGTNNLGIRNVYRSGLSERLLETPYLLTVAIEGSRRYHK
jgi:hypothetical protein